MKGAVPTALQPWYADDAAVEGIFEEIEKVFNLLMSTGPARRYFPEPIKSIFIIKSAMAKREKAQFDYIGFTVVSWAASYG